MCSVGFCGFVEQDVDALEGDVLVGFHKKDNMKVFKNAVLEVQSFGG